MPSRREGFSGYDEIQQWLGEEFGLEVTYKSVYNLVCYHLGAKLKVPRPEHPRKHSRGRSVCCAPERRRLAAVEAFTDETSYLDTSADD